MNKRIQKLAEQADPYLYERCAGDGFYFDYEKFAELIVRECITQCEKNKDHEWLGPGSKLSASNIKEHFGLKE